MSAANLPQPLIVALADAYLKLTSVNRTALAHPTTVQHVIGLLAVKPDPVTWTPAEHALFDLLRPTPMKAAPTLARQRDPEIPF